MFVSSGSFDYKGTTLAGVGHVPGDRRGQGTNVRAFEQKNGPLSRQH
jgi:hypothetical protein